MSFMARRERGIWHPQLQVPANNGILSVFSLMTWRQMHAQIGSDNWALVVATSHPINSILGAHLECCDSYYLTDDTWVAPWSLHCPVIFRGNPVPLLEIVLHGMTHAMMPVSQDGPISSWHQCIRNITQSLITLLPGFQAPPAMKSSP